MERITLAPDLEFSRIAYGMWRLDEDDCSPAHIRAKVDACLAQGITTMDHADIYGGYTAEEYFGAVLKEAPALRDDIEIVTKCDILIPAGRYSDVKVKHYNTSRAHIEASVEHSLRLLNTDHIDLLLIHRPDPFMDAEETGGALDAVVASGKVGHVGVSNFKLHDWSLLQSAMSTPLVTNQIEISLSEAAPFTNGDIAFLQERKVVPMAWSPLGGGAIFSDRGPLGEKLAAKAEESDTDVTSVALAWLMAHPAKILPVMGTNKLERIASFHKAFDVSISREEWFDLYQAAIGAEVP